MRLQTHQSGTDSAARPRASSAPGAEDRVNERLERARRCGQVEDLQGLCRALDPALTWNSAGSSRMTVSNARAAPPKSPRCTSSAPLAPIRNDERSSSEGGGNSWGSAAAGSFTGRVVNICWRAYPLRSARKYRHKCTAPAPKDTPRCGVRSGNASRGASNPGL